MEDVRERFCDFLAELGEGQLAAGAWQRFAVAHDPHEGLEAARRELVAMSLQHELTSPEFRAKCRALRERLLAAEYRSVR